MEGQNELSEITGIGPARARWLKKTFGIQRIRDLARLSPDDIEHELRAEGRERVSRKAIDAWVTEARVRASEETGEETGKSAITAPAKDLGGRARDDPPEWKPLTSFVIEFQSRTEEGVQPAWRTSVHYLEQDLNETWAGIDCAGLCQWMTEHLRDAEGPADLGHPEEASAEEAPGALALAADRPRVQLRAHVVDGDGVERASLIRIDKPWAVVFGWSLEGDVPIQEVDEWQLDVLFKPLGPGEPLRLPETPLHLPVARPRIDGAYRYRFEVVTGVVNSSHVDTIYRASATISYRSLAEDGLLAAGFADLGLLRFYQVLVPAGPASPLAGVQSS